MWSDASAITQKQPELERVLLIGSSIPPQHDFNSKFFVEHVADKPMNGNKKFKSCVTSVLNGGRYYMKDTVREAVNTDRKLSVGIPINFRPVWRWFELNTVNT